MDIRTKRLSIFVGSLFSVILSILGQVERHERKNN